MRALRPGVHFIKDNLMEVPPIFRAIQKASGTSDREMFEVYNMGHRMEALLQEVRRGEVVAISESSGIAAQVVGRTEKSARADGKNHVTIRRTGGAIEYGPRD